VWYCCGAAAWRRGRIKIMYAFVL